MSKPFTRIADRIAERIANGELPVGTQLPPQRSFAFEEGIAVSSASRVYDELRRRGLVAGEVGRGTYVTNRFAALDPSLQEPSGAGIDLEIIFRLGESAREQTSASTNRFFKSGITEKAAAPPSVKGNSKALKAVAELTTTAGYHVEPQALLLAGSGKEAIAASLAALAPRGGRVAVEALTYPFAIAAARLLGIELVPLHMDNEGVTPEALTNQAAMGLDGVYLQPTLQSPLVLTMTQTRRKAIAEILIKHDLTAIEDRVYGFLKPAPPIASYAPSHVILIDSLSKRLMPGLALGAIAAPSRLHDQLARSIRAGGWMAPSLSVELARHWIEDGTVAAVEALKRSDAEAMFSVAKKSLANLDFRGENGSLHGWLELPTGWRGESFAAACAELGIAVAPGHAFAVMPGTAPSGVRIAYSARDLQTWKFALRELARVAQSAPSSD